MQTASRKARIQLFENATLTAYKGCRFLPLSDGQRAIWLLQNTFSSAAVHNLKFAWKISPHPDILFLERALHQLVNRHIALSSSYVLNDGEPMQLNRNCRFELEVKDTSTLTEVQFADHLAVQAHLPFHFELPPLLRAVLFVRNNAEAVLLLTMHEIAVDTSSARLLQEELSMLYSSEAAGQNVTPTQNGFDRNHVAVWQREWLEGGVLEEQLGYWRRQLEGMPAMLELPTDHPRPAVQAFRGAERRFVVAGEVNQGLKELGQRHGATLFMTLLAAYQTLLYRYTRQQDLVIGTPIANRNRAETEKLIGFFANTLVLRTDLSGEPGFAELLERTRQVCLGAYANQDVPFEKIVEQLQPERDLSYSPMFQVMFVFQNTGGTGLQLPGLEVKPLAIESRVAKFDLSLVMEESAEGLAGTLEYNTDLFEAETMARMAQHFQVLLSSIVEHPQHRISELGMLTTSERHELLVEWNKTTVEFCREQYAHQLFEAHAARTPDATAVVFEGTKLSYRELNERSNQLAHYLRQLGVGPDVLVGISVERSPDIVIGLLGILKAGGAYVPLDPSYPAGRLGFMLEDTRLSVLLTQHHLLERLPQHQARVVCLDSDREEIGRHRRDNPVNLVGEEHLAYVIYTSGSTGKPKGSLLTHLGLRHLAEAQAQVYDPQHDCRILQFSSFSFDASLYEMAQALFSGATLYLATREALQPGPQLTSLLRQLEITTITITPSVLALLSPEECPTLRTVIVAGEACPRELMARWATGRRFLNAYGPTETTSWGTVAECSADSSIVPIGRPIANTQIYIVDAHLQPVPVGLAGEILIGGLGVGRGYLNRPELTKEKFIADPFTDRPGSRLYRTGDLGRYLPDGTIEFLGRIDHQIKIRGFRIEVGEIEAALIAQPAVQEAVILVREEIPGDKRLVAYVVLNKGQQLSTQELRTRLQQELPNYMVPSAFVMLPCLPLSPNGKLDRDALPPPEHAKLDHEHAYLAPRDVIETQLVNIWEDLSNIKGIGITDHFFHDLGGHSLLAVRLMARIHAAFGQELPISVLFQGPTIEKLAEIVRHTSARQKHPSLVPIQPLGARPPLFCVHPGGGNVFAYVDLARQLPSGQPFYGLQSRALEEHSTPQLSVEAMAADYLEAVRQVQAHGPYYLAGWSFGGLVAFQMAQQLRDVGEEVAIVGLIDSFPVPSGRKLPDETTILSQFIGDLVALSNRDAAISPDRIRHLPPEVQLGHIVDDLKRQSVLPPDIELNHMRHLLEVYTANLRAMFHHQPGGKYPGKVVLFCAEEHTAEEKDEAIAAWSHALQSELSLETVSGNHYSILRQPNLQALAQGLGKYLELA